MRFEKGRPGNAPAARRCGFDQVIREVRRIVPRPTRISRLLRAPWIRVYPQLRLSVAMRTMSCSMSTFVRGRPGRRRSRKVHFLATSSRCQRSKVAGVTMGSRLLNAFPPTSLASLASVRRSAAVKIIRRRPSRARRARFSALRYSMRAAACRSSQHAMPADTKARKDPGPTNIDPCYRSRRAICNSSFRTLRHSARPFPLAAGFLGHLSAHCTIYRHAVTGFKVLGVLELERRRKLLSTTSKQLKFRLWSQYAKFICGVSSLFLLFDVHL